MGLALSPSVQVHDQDVQQHPSYQELQQQRRSQAILRSGSSELIPLHQRNQHLLPEPRLIWFPLRILILLQLYQFRVVIQLHHESADLRDVRHIRYECELR